MSIVNHVTAPLKSDLYGQLVVDGVAITQVANITDGDIDPELWIGVGSSDEDDNYENGVIKPTLQEGNGRWIKRNWKDSSKRIETHTGVTAGTDPNDGQLTITFNSPFANPPHVIADTITSSTVREIRVLSVSTTQCVVRVTDRNVATILTVQVLLGIVVNVNGVTVNVVAIEN